MTLRLVEMPPEILHTACSFLDDKDARLLRRTCKSVGAVADCYAFQQLTFYLHAGDFDMLRYFASHDVFCRNVKSLIYVTRILPQRRLSFKKFVAHKNEADTLWYKTLRPILSPHERSRRPAQRPSYNDADFRKAYDTYVEFHARQSEILANGEDFAVLKEVVPKFTGLREIMVSADSWFREGSWARTPFDTLFVLPHGELEPTAVRHVGSLMLPLVGLGPRIQGLFLGVVDWSFPHQLQDPSRFMQMVEICQNLTTFDIQIDTGMDAADEEGIFVAECREVIRNGDMRRLLEALTSLASLTVGFSFMNKESGLYPAAFRDLISETTHWPNLRHVKFEMIEASRQDLVDFFSLHSSTLRTIELRDVRLVRSSWRVFLPQLRELAEEMFLDDILLTGEVEGESEKDIAPEHGEERFDFGDPNVSESECLFDDITDYILWADGPNPLDSFP